MNEANMYAEISALLSRIKKVGKTLTLTNIAFSDFLVRVVTKDVFFKR